MVTRSVCLGLVAALAGCSLTVPGLDAGILFPCSSQIACPPGQECGGNGFCRAAVDGGRYRQLQRKLDRQLQRQLDRKLDQQLERLHQQQRLDRERKLGGL